MWWISMVSSLGKPFQTHEDKENIGKHIVLTKTFDQPFQNISDP